MSEDWRTKVSIDDIKAAAERISKNAKLTPCDDVPNLSKMCNCNLWFKEEIHQRCRAFKFRGALSKVSKIPPGSTIVCASAGNHSQGCALSAQLCGSRCIVYMPLTAPVSKVDATKAYGAEVRQCGLSFDEAKKQLEKDLAENPDWIFVPPFDDYDVIAGQGTIGLEVANQVPDVDYIVCAVGGGGLCAGVAIAMKALCPKAKIIAVNAAVRPASYIKFKEAKGQPIDPIAYHKFTGNPLADGIAVLDPGHLTTPIIRDLVDDFVLVSEDEISEAIALLAERFKIVVEGAGATTFASVLFKKFEFKPTDNIVCVLSGGNIELQMLSRVIDRALFLRERRVHFQVSLPVQCDEYIKMLTILRKYKFEVVGTFVLPNAACFANHIRYAVTVDIPNPALLANVQDEFTAKGWKISITNTNPGEN